ncbi:MAG: hypothetical protein QGH58_08270 [Arenicellales bacterium]|nr:hypothetical protein [Arenicellales bacterium]MDP6791887.1 hypothetical protein [Arenicellales bacterium]MDP6947743.1 hypothetical protein [Arenicellales bacterium]
MIKEFSQLLGPLRFALALVLGALSALAPLAFAPTSYQGWAFVTTVIVPAIVPIFFFVALLDILMSAVFMSSSTGERRAKHRKALITQAVLVGILTAAWLPLFWQVLNPG